ncbi:MAG: response regulator [Dysgonamonadaceae bacterium]
MFKVNSKNLYFYFIGLLISQFFFSCNIKQEYKAEELIMAKIHAEKRDSLIAESKALNNRGTVARNMADYQEALNLHFKALSLAEEAKDTLSQIYALNNIGTDLRRTYSNMEASTYHYLALELSANNPKYLKMHAMAMNGLGNIFLVLNNKEQAQHYFYRALANEKESNNNLGQAINYANLAESFNISHDLDSALYYYNESLKQNKIIKSDIGEAICKRAMGLIYFEKGNHTLAVELLSEAYSLMENSKDAFHKLEVQIALAETLIDLNELNEAEKHALDILNLAKAIDSYEYQQRAYDVLAELREKQQRYQLAYEAKEKAFIYRDSVMAQNSEVRILELENRYKGKEAEHQIQLLTTEKNLTEKNRIDQQRIFFLLILLLSGSIGFLYYRNHNSRKISKELEEINEMKSRFFSNVSHEFRTPLTLIKGPLENWLEEELTPEFEKNVTMMLRNSDRLLFLVDQLLSLSKVDSGNFQIIPQQADLSLAIKGISNSFLHFVKEKSINYNIDIEESGESLVDLHIVEIIVSNLLSNALKFTEANGDISLRGKKKGNSYIVKVANTGQRLADEQLSKMFDRFYTDGPSHYSGTGIGLSLVKELCSLYNADLKVEYNENNEIEFTVVFPSLKKVDKTDSKDLALEKINIERFYHQEVSAETTNEEGKDKEPAFSEMPLLLIVEDNDDLRKYIVETFKNRYKTIEAKDGEEGISLAKEHIPDIIISDIMMPKVSGLELCDILKSDASTNHIPIILLTALNEEKDIIAGLKNRADDYVTKPFGAKILRYKVHNLIETRNVLSRKYRKEILLKPHDLLINKEEDAFAVILGKVIEEEITNPNFGVDEFCKVAAMSRAQLYRKLKATVDMSVSEFIRVHRVKTASELFKNENLNVTDVCYASGFSDASYFSKSFKDVFKVPPAKYRKMLHEKQSEIK